MGEGQQGKQKDVQIGKVQAACWDVALCFIEKLGDPEKDQGQLVKYPGCVRQRI